MRDGGLREVPFRRRVRVAVKREDAACCQRAARQIMIDVLTPRIPTDPTPSSVRRQTTSGDLQSEKGSFTPKCALSTCSQRELPIPMIIVKVAVSIALAPTVIVRIANIRTGRGSRAHK